MQFERSNISRGDQVIEATEDARYVVGVDIGGTNLRLALADMTGNVIFKSSYSTSGIREPEAVISLLVDGLHSLLCQAEAPTDAIKSIAVGIPGVTDVETGIVIATSYLMGWRNVPLRIKLEEALHIPVIVDNDVNFAAIGENWKGVAQDIQDFVFLAIGTGIGAGILLNGQSYPGSSWAAGEIGYMLLPGMIDGPGKPNEPGALEEMIGGEGIKNRWRKMSKSAETLLSSELTATEIFDYALRGEALAQTLLQSSATTLAHAIYNVSLVLNCPLFVLGGTVGLHPALHNETKKVLESWNIRGCPRLERSALGADAQLLGAVRAALDAAHSTAPPIHA